MLNWNILISLKLDFELYSNSRKLFNFCDLNFYTKINIFFTKGVEDPNMPTDKPIKNDEKEREDLSVEKTKKIMSAKKAKKPPAR